MGDCIVQHLRWASSGAFPFPVDVRYYPQLKLESVTAALEENLARGLSEASSYSACVVAAHCFSNALFAAAVEEVSSANASGSCSASRDAATGTRAELLRVCQRFGCGKLFVCVEFERAQAPSPDILDTFGEQRRAVLRRPLSTPLARHWSHPSIGETTAENDPGRSGVFGGESLVVRPPPELVRPASCEVSLLHLNISDPGCWSTANSLSVGGQTMVAVNIRWCLLKRLAATSGTSPP